jgi:hypothetical protein
MRGVTIESCSHESYEDALNKALAEASTHLTDIYEAHIFVREFSWSEETGFCARIEINLASGGLKPDLEGEFYEMERQADRDFKIYLSQRYDRLREMVERYLKDRTYVNLATTPEIILSRLKPEDLLEKIVITDFHEAVVPDAPALTAESEQMPVTVPEAAQEEPEPEPE